VAHVTTYRAIKALDLRHIYINATTSLGLHSAKIPIYFPNDREAIHEALATLASLHPEKVRIVRIINTLSLERMLISECCSEMLEKRPGVSIIGQARAMRFDEAGNLLPF
jgi:hypothetical protein